MLFSLLLWVLFFALVFNKSLFNRLLPLFINNIFSLYPTQERNSFFTKKQKMNCILIERGMVSSRVALLPLFYRFVRKNNISPHFSSFFSGWVMHSSTYALAVGWTDGRLAFRSVEPLCVYLCWMGRSRRPPCDDGSVVCCFSFPFACVCVLERWVVT